MPRKDVRKRSVALRRTFRQEAVSARQAGALDEFRAFSREALANAALDEYERGLVLLSIDEVLTATVESGLPRGSEARIRLVIDINDVRVRIMIEDSETRFENHMDGEDFTQQREDAGRREVDVVFLNSIMDEVTYTFQKGLQNRLVMTKFIAGGT